MAKKKKKAAKKAVPKPEPKEPSAFWHGVIAVALIVAAIILIFGAFTEAPIPSGVWDLAWIIIGGSAYLLIPLLAYFGITKFKTDDHKIPRGQFYSGFGALILLSGLLNALLQKPDVTSEQDATVYGGELGSLVGGTLADALGQVLAVIILLGLLTVLVFVFFKIHPSVLLKPFSKNDEEGEGSEDLADLKARMPGFKLNEGVPTVSHSEQKSAAKIAAVRAAAQKMTPGTDNMPALTAASDPDWQFPSIELLSDKQDKADPGNIEHNAELLKEVFNEFNMEVIIEGANVGPRVTQYVVKPPSGVKMNRIEALDKNISLALASKHDVRIQAPIPGMRAVGIEVANIKSASVTLRGVMESSEWKQMGGHNLAFAVGKDLAGKSIVADLEDMPHLLIGGQTKSGKSVMINSLLAGLLFKNSPSDLKLILVDPKFVEMEPYKDIPHLLSPVIQEPEKCISSLKWAVAEMDRRLKLFASEKVRDIQAYNKLKDQEGMPHIVIVIDELADLMMVAPRDVEGLIARIAQKARAAGIHLVLATQRPEANIVTGLIKSNLPARIAFAVQDQINSRIILDSMGAEKLFGKGDMLYKTSDINRPIRIQGALINTDEVNKLTDFLREQREPDYNDEIISQPVQLGRGGVVAPIDGEDDNDKAWEDAVRVVIDSRKASTALLQRKLRIGYGRAARIIDQMEEQGIISISEGGNKSREVLVTSMDEVFGSEASDEMPSEDIYDEIPLDDEEEK